MSLCYRYWRGERRTGRGGENKDTWEDEEMFGELHVCPVAVAASPDRALWAGLMDAWTPPPSPLLLSVRVPVASGWRIQDGEEDLKHSQTQHSIKTSDMSHGCVVSLGTMQCCPVIQNFTLETFSHTIHTYKDNSAKIISCLMKVLTCSGASVEGLKIQRESTHELIYVNVQLFVPLNYFTDLNECLCRLLLCLGSTSFQLILVFNILMFLALGMSHLPIYFFKLN